MPRSTRVANVYAQPAPFFERVYDETLRLSALETTQANARPNALYTYLVRSLRGRDAQDTLARSLQLTEHFLVRAPTGVAATLARAEVSRAIACLSPAYATALGCVAHFGYRTVAASLQAELTHMQTAPVDTPQDGGFVGMKDLRATQAHMLTFWPRAMLDERLALHWASLDQGAHIEGFLAATAVYPKSWDAGLFARLRRNVDAVYDDVSHLLAAPMTPGDYAEVDDIDAVYTKMGMPSIKALIAHLMMTSGRTDCRREHTLLHRAILDAHAGLAMVRIRTFLCSTLGNRFLEGRTLAEAAWAKDAFLLMDRADGADGARNDHRAFGFWNRR